MNQDPVRISQVHWAQVFPSLRLLRAASLGTGLSTMVLAGSCLIVAWLGSSWANSLMSNGSITAVCDFPWPAYGRLDTSLDARIDLRELQATTRALPAPASTLIHSAARLLPGEQVAALLSGNPAPGSWLLSLDLLVWNAVVLGFFGTAIARSAALSFCSQSRSGVFASLRHAAKHFRQTLLATGLILLLCGSLRLLLAITRLVAGTGPTGQLIVSLAWGIVFPISVLLIIAGAVGGTAWFLSLAATGTDSCSGAEGLSRCISYVLSHWLWTAASVSSVVLLSLAMRWLVQLLLLAALFALPDHLQQPSVDGVRRLWMFGFELIPYVVQLSVFLSGLTVMYVLLRQREDGIGLEETDGAA